MSSHNKGLIIKVFEHISISIFIINYITYFIQSVLLCFFYFPVPTNIHLKNAVKVCPVLLGSGAILCPVAFCQLKWVPTVWAAGWRLLALQPLPGRTVTSDPTQMGPQANTLAHGWIPPQSEWQSGHGGRPTGHCGSWGWAALTGPKC